MQVEPDSEYLYGNLWQRQNRQHSPMNSIRQQIFECCREELLDRRAGTVNNSMRTTKILFLFIRQCSIPTYRPPSFGTIN